MCFHGCVVSCYQARDVVVPLACTRETHDGCVQRIAEDARRIRAKEGDGYELTQGQAAALLHAERGADKLREEVEELETVLQVSTSQSVCAVAVLLCCRRCVWS